MPNSQNILQESIFVPVTVYTQLHLRHLQGSPDGPVAFLIHGAIENGKIFYSDRGKGFAWYLARAGWDVYIADLGGRGLSSPPINAQTLSGQTESICQELPALLETIHLHRPNAPISWVSHSWGGVLLMSLLARLYTEPQLKNFPELNPAALLPAAIVQFGVKRSVRAQNREKWLKIDGFWLQAAFALIKLYGYLPARELKIGSDNESRKSHLQSVQWVRPSAWRDSDDGFDYAKVFNQTEVQRRLPPSLWLAGKHDYSLGHPDDVKRFMQECACQDADYWLLAKSQGFAHDYGHINMLTHPDAEQDHFPRVLAWLEQTISRSNSRSKR